MKSSFDAGPLPSLCGAFDSASTQGRKILLVEPRHAVPTNLPGLEHGEVTCAPLAAVDADLLVRLCPDVVLAPLMTPSFDMLDLTRLLWQLDFPGQVRALTPAIPDPHLVCSEIMAACPGLDFDLIVVKPD
ncbi:MAG: hypothetical protein CVT82_03335 [Alphaproteobacteria bacterium HGW-Alphaproteobacteria-4]|nr:MAG: hypothetical protein CVT82_03335 [Alphaproteobacteria bacterium HGW-Alphaproteobacteria-4]